MRNSSVAKATPAPLAAVDGWPINIANEHDAIDAIVGAAKCSEGFAAFTLNLDHLVKLRRDPLFRYAYGRAKFVTADGTPVARIAAFTNPRIERTTGADLVVPLAAAAARAKIPVYLFGTTPEVLAKAGVDLATRSELALDTAGSLAPGRNFDPRGPEADAAIDQIVASGARLCFVALGAPKQEIFAAYAVERGAKVGFVCIGAALDFLAGAQVRAPGFMRNNGMEWLWRLATNPRRLAGRYAQCALVLADVVLIAPLRERLLQPRV